MWKELSAELYSIEFFLNISSMIKGYEQQKYEDI